jgi:polyisoprenoid-binding protein YceI
LNSEPDQTQQIKPMKGSTMKLLKLASILLLAAPFAAPIASHAQASTWKSDAAHSEADFAVKHLAITNVRGRLGKIDATLVWDDKDVSKSTVNATIDVTGIDTGNSGRDGDLKSPSWFDADKFPTATFVSTSVAKGGAGLKVTGNLTLKGVTKQVVLDVDGPTKPITGMDKKPHTGFSASTTIHRTDFGIGAAPDSIVSDEVKITLDLDFAKQ